MGYNKVLFQLKNAEDPVANGKLFDWGDSVPSDAATGYATGCLFLQTDGTTVATTVYTNIGDETSANFDAVSGGDSTATLDTAFDLDGEIDGTAAATPVKIGDGTDGLSLYTEASAPTLATFGTANLTIAPDGGTTAVTGILTVSSNATVTGNLTVSGTASIGQVTLDAISAATADTALSLDGKGTGGIKLGETSTGNVVLYRNSVLQASRTLTLTGVGGSNILTITAGDAVMSDGSLTITDADNAATVSVTNNTITTDTFISLGSTSLTTGKGISLVADAVTSGSMVYLETSATSFTGKYIQCYDGAADDFSVGLYGATIIAGNAAGTDAITITAGDIGITAGYIDLDNGKIEVDTTGNIGNYFKRNQGTTTVPLLELECTATSDDQPCLLIDANQNAGVNAMEIEYDGTAAGLKITPSAATGTALELLCAANATDSVLKLDGTTGDWIGADAVGLLNISCDGALAHANASCLNIVYSGTGAASGMGTSLRIVDTGATSTSYAMYLSAATGEALKVDAGKCVFDEQIEISGGFKTTTGAFVLSDSGAASMDIDGGGANDILNIGSAVATDVLFHGSGAAGEDCLWDSSGSSLSFASGAALVLPQGTGSGGSGRQDVTGSVFYETDAKKLWVYDGAGWVGVALA